MQLMNLNLKVETSKQMDANLGLMTLDHVMQQAD